MFARYYLTYRCIPITFSFFFILLCFCLSSPLLPLLFFSYLSLGDDTKWLTRVYLLLKKKKINFFLHPALFLSFLSTSVPFLVLSGRWHKNDSQELMCYYRLAFWVKFSADDILKYFSYFSQKTKFDIFCKLSSNPVFWNKNRTNTFYASIFQLIDNVSCLISPGMVLRWVSRLLIWRKMKNHGPKSQCWQKV